MTLSTWLPFLTVSLATTFSPGPAILLAISNSMTQGPRKVLVSSAGNALGIFLVSAAAMIGLGALLRTSATLFLGVKLIGAAYLIYLGVKQWRGAGKRFPSQAELAQATPEKSALSLFQEGLWVALTNPKSILFFTALLPQFLQTGEAILPQFFLLTGTFIACALLAHAAFVVLATRAKGWFTTSAGISRLNRASGAVFVLLGASLLALRRPTAT